jgi:hypothetical protein
VDGGEGLVFLQRHATRGGVHLWSIEHILVQLWRSYFVNPDEFTKCNCRMHYNGISSIYNSKVYGKRSYGYVK